VVFTGTRAVAAGVLDEAELAGKAQLRRVPAHTSKCILDHFAVLRTLSDDFALEKGLTIGK
tara:strand:- start:44 stop:226 length:183 start_codon:yes stop_codon:yes gene_type:complete